LTKAEKQESKLSQELVPEIPPHQLEMPREPAPEPSSTLGRQTRLSSSADDNERDSIPLGRKLIDAVIVLSALTFTLLFFRRRRVRQASEQIGQKPCDNRDQEGYIHITADAPDGEGLHAEARAQRIKARSMKSESFAKPAPAVFPGKNSISTAEKFNDGSDPHSELTGTLDLFHVSSLLRMIGSCSRPGTLIVRGSHDEKRIHFRLGKITAAYSVNHDSGVRSGFLMNKLGYLLVRMGLISEEQRDQALELCAANPQRRLGETLVEMNALAPDDLKQALRTQAEGVVFSLFLFPQGRFKMLDEDSGVDPVDDLELRVNDLLDEAARHEEEWAGLRKAIPSLETVLDFDEQGRQKLSGARMTEHQQAVLDLIDGRRDLKSICREATMLDFEVYKFVYLMVRARILKPVRIG
jgi:hypothetical protein